MLVPSVGVSVDKHIYNDNPQHHLYSQSHGETYVTTNPNPTLTLTPIRPNPNPNPNPNHIPNPNQNSNPDLKTSMLS